MYSLPRPPAVFAVCFMFCTNKPCRISDVASMFVSDML